MDKNQMKIERLNIMQDINALNARSQAGEDVTTELRHCGKRLDKLGKHKARVNVMDATEVKESVDANFYVEITKEMYKRAVSNGIPASVVRQRIHRDGWDAERAITSEMGRRKTLDFKGMTVEFYKRLKEEGLRDSDICKKYEIKKNALHGFKLKNGITRTKEKVAVK